MKRIVGMSVLLAVPVFGGQSKVVSEKNPFSVARPDTQKAYIQPIVLNDGSQGEINWTEGYIRVRGYGVKPEKVKNPAQAWLMADRAATVVAQRNLLEAVQGVYINSETVVRDMMLESDVIRTQVEGLLVGARMVGHPHHLPDGRSMVEMELPLYGMNGLASALPGGEAKTDPKAAKKLEDVPCVVIDAQGTGAKPALLPRFFDEKGNLVLDMADIVDPNNPQGLKYVRDLGDMVQCGDDAWVIKALEAKGKAKADLVVSKESKDKLKWLKKAGKVVWETGKFLLGLF